MFTGTRQYCCNNNMEQWASCVTGSQLFIFCGLCIQTLQMSVVLREERGLRVF